MNFLERALSVVSPRLAAKRIYDRHLLLKARSFDAAGFGRNAQVWSRGAGATSASAETQSSLSTLRNRSRAMRRNNGWYRRAIEAITNNVIGHGIMASFQSSAKARAERVNELYHKWANSTECDAEGQLNLYGLQRLVCDTLIESGEALIVLKYVRNSPADVCPLRLHVLEPDYIDVSRDLYPLTGSGAKRVVEGIEYDQNDRVTGYWLFKQHPGDRVAYKAGYRESQFVPASQVIHVFRKDRPGQGRGLPWGHAIMLLLQDLHDYQGTQLLRQKIAACFTMFITDVNADVSEPSKALSDKIEPGAIEVLPGGRDVKFAQPPALIGYNEYIEACLYEAAAGFGITFEAMTGNYSKVNFTSGRMGHIEFRRNVEAWRWTMLGPQMLNRIADEFLMGVDLLGVDVSKVTFDWTAPRHELLNPKEEYASMRDAIRAGLLTLSEGLRSLGLNPDKHLREYKKDLDLLDQLGIVLDSDPRKTSQQGQSQQTQTGAGNGDDIE